MEKIFKEEKKQKARGQTKSGTVDTHMCLVLKPTEGEEIPYFSEEWLRPTVLDNCENYIERK